MYSADLAHIHDVGFGGFAEKVGPQIVRLLRAAGIPSGLVVEVGCGSGLVARRLTEAGYEVLGLDISPSMIRLARAKAPNARFRVASLADAKIPRCEAVISVGEVVTYVPGGIRVLRRFFERVYQSLQPGGLFVFDFIASPRGRTYATKTIGAPGWTLAVRSDFDQRARVLTRRIAMARETRGRVRHASETHRVRVYTRRELVSAVEQCGFSVETSGSIGRHKLMASNVAVVARRV